MALKENVRQAFKECVELREENAALKKTVARLEAMVTLDCRESGVCPDLKELETENERLRSENGSFHRRLCIVTTERDQEKTRADSNAVANEEACKFAHGLKTANEKLRELLDESMQFCQRIDGDGDPLNIHLARRIHKVLAP